MESTKQGGVIAYVCSSSSAFSQESCMSDSSNSQSPSSSPRPPTNKKRVTEPPAKSTHTRRHTADKTSTKSSITKLNGMVLLCKVCGDVASGFHYGVHACEGCKGFFRRSIQQNIQYKKCLKTESCTIVRINRNRCQQCRFRKCLSVGMSRDAVRFGRIPKREKQRMLLEMQTAMNNMMNNSQIQHILHAAPCPSDSSSSSSSSPPDSPRSESVTMDTSMSSASSCSSDSGEEDTANAMYAQTRTTSCPETQLNRCPKEEEDEELWSRWNGSPAETSSHGNNDNQAHRGHLVCPMNVSPFVDPCKAGHEVWEDFSRSFIPAVREVVEFAKQIPGFQHLSTHDQVNLLKAGTFEVLMVRFASLFDARARTVTFMSGRTFSVDALRLAGAGELLGCMFDFSEKLSALQLDHEEMSLFTAVVLVSADRSAIENVNAVEALQETLIRALRNLIMKNHSNESAIFTKLLLKLPELRSLNNMHSEELLAFQIHA